jgi:hypothetical protein
MKYEAHIHSFVCLSKKYKKYSRRTLHYIFQKENNTKLKHVIEKYLFKVFLYANCSGGKNMRKLSKSQKTRYMLYSVMA